MGVKAFSLPGPTALQDIATSLLVHKGIRVRLWALGHDKCLPWDDESMQVMQSPSHLNIFNPIALHMQKKRAKKIL